MTVLKCFKCDKELKVDEHCGYDCIGMLYGGTIWKSSGNYGSALFDACSKAEGYLEIVICDTCLEEKKSAVRHCTIKTEQKDESIVDPGAIVMTRFERVTRIWLEKNTVTDFMKI